ncbi:MAG: proline--tRNA ligase [Candidatus Shapirobacteria bacterium]
MLYSKLFGKTVREAPKGALLASHKLLYRAGFVRDLCAGRLMLTPLGERVEQKIIQIIDEEMAAIGSQRVTVPTFHPLELWQATHRDEAFGAGLTQVTDRRGAKFAVGATAEAVMVEFVKKFSPSWRDLPIVIHQFSNKFRDELRVRGGLIRAREFLMKDAYSFTADEKSFLKTYQDQYRAYEKIAQRLEIEVVSVEADSGALGGDFCHEFIFLCDQGEDFILACSCGYAANREKAEFVRDQINFQDEILPLKIVDQPEWVETMADNVKHYRLPESRFLKNVVYKTIKGKIIIAVVRGDLDINLAKLTKVVGRGELQPAEEADLKKIGTKTGWVHSWGHQAEYVGDLSLTTVKNFIGGQKEKATDALNVNYGRDFECAILADIAEAKGGYLCAKCQKHQLKTQRGIEFGHIFKYDDFYTKAMKGVFTDKDGQQKFLQMGAFGIGVGRAMAIVVEAHHDEKGIIWPKAIAPYQAHLIEVSAKDESALGGKSYEELSKMGIEVLWDDREDVSAGEKFANADLIGLPVRLVVSVKTGDKIEWKERNQDKNELISPAEVVKRLRKR